jgi:hypothetical protein
VLGHQQSTHGEILVQLRPVDTDPATHESPVTQSIRAGVAQLGEPLERHADGSAIFEMDNEIAFEDLYAEGSGTFRCRNTHATSPGNRCDAESPII